MKCDWPVICRLGILGIGLGGAAVAAQDAPPPASRPADAEKTGSVYEEFTEGMTLEQAVARAYELIGVAEKRGEGAADALKKADTLLGFIRNKDPLNADGDFLFGRTHLLLRRSREAIQYIDRYASSQKGSNDWLAFRFLGDLYLDAKYYAQAGSKYRRATELSPSEPEPHAGLAKTELQQNRPAVAEEHARKAVDLDASKTPAERNPMFYSVLAESLLGQNKIDEALDSAGRAEELGRARAMADPGDPSLLHRLDDYQELLEKALRAVVKTDPERRQEFVRLIRVLRDRADVAHLLKYHGVLQSVQAAIERTAPNTPTELVLEQAKLFVEVGDNKEARRVLEELLAKEPENAEAKQLLNELGGPAPTAPEP